LLRDTRTDIASVGAAGRPFNFGWRADGKQHWVRVDVRDSAGHLALVGNPIYVRASAGAAR